MILKLITQISRILVGALFVFSGFVKLVDPIGSQYKFQEYFSETVLNMEFLIPYALPFAILLIIAEILLGVMILIGYKPKFTVFSLFILTLVFLFLTWYSAYYNKVTDCGCFGDFIKLKPKVSFLKDIFLLIPAILFIVFNKNLFTLFTPVTRNSILAISLAGFTFYSFSNFVWDLPHTDFRPFKIGNNIREMKKSEKEAAAAVKIVAYKMTNLKSGEIVEVPFDTYMLEYSKYPTSEWKLEQMKSEPAIEKTPEQVFLEGEVCNMDDGCLSCGS